MYPMVKKGNSAGERDSRLVVMVVPTSIIAIAMKTVYGLIITGNTKK